MDMDLIAQIGVLARWKYAKTPLWSAGLAERVEASPASPQHRREFAEPGSGVRSAMEDVLGEQIRVYSKDGDAVDLAQGGTPIDFAYRIHSELGNQCLEAQVNDLPFPLNRPLRNGDQVRICKNARAQPMRAWLDEDLGCITTTYARMRARRWFRRLPEDEAIRQGRDILLHELTMLGLPNQSHEAIANLFGYEDADKLLQRRPRRIAANRAIDAHPVRPLDAGRQPAGGQRRDRRRRCELHSHQCRQPPAPHLRHLRPAAA